jgi:TRAP-type C4-dicarboxylate transport system permease small subunit
VTFFALLRDAVALAERVLGWAVIAIVVGLLAVVVGQLVDRHVVPLPIDAPDQYVRVGIIWLTFLGFALAVSERSAIRVDLIDHWLSPRAQDRLALACDAMMLAMAAIVTIKGWRVVEVGGSQILLGTPYSAALPNSGLFVGSLLIVAFLAARMLARLDPARRRDDA